MKIVHGILKNHYKFTEKIRFPIYRNTQKIIPDIPIKLRKYLNKKFKKFRIISDGYKYNYILEFTFGIDSDCTDSNSKVSCVAVVHPKDQFNRKIGYAIVKGRILKFEKETILIGVNQSYKCLVCVSYVECPLINNILCKKFKRSVPDYMEESGE